MANVEIAVEITALTSEGIVVDMIHRKAYLDRAVLIQRVSSLLDSRRQGIQHRHGVFPTNAGIRDADAVR